jgi:hypothetical protein
MTIAKTSARTVARTITQALAMASSLGLLAAATVRAQTAGYSTVLPAASTAGASETVDSIAARIEDDILTESELRELGAFQTLVDGQSKSRADLIRELEDQWIVRGEATAASYPRPSDEDVDRAYSQLERQFPSPDEFKRRCASAGLSEAAVRRLLAEQLYLSRFLDFRFRPAAQVTEAQINDYYTNEFASQLKKRGQPVPAIEDVDDTIREVLVQRAINDRANAWLDDTRGRLQIDVLQPGARP